MPLIMKVLQLLQNSKAASKVEVEKPTYGGQAVMEGVMMRSKNAYAMAVRKPNGEIATTTEKMTDHSQSLSFLKLPIARGIYAFGSSLALGMKMLSQSAEMAAEMAERAEIEIENMGIALLGAGAMVAGMFVLLPHGAGALFVRLRGGKAFGRGAVEAVARTGIFAGYIGAVSHVAEIKRIFAYHGAEHKTLAAHESGIPLTIENVRPFSRLHKRCGTSFLLINMAVSAAVYAVAPTPKTVGARLLSRVLLMPVVAGLSYEVTRWAGRTDHKVVDWVSAPGLLLQRLTTAEPDTEQLEVAITALQTLLAHEPA